jgi:hypothetical protein
MGVTDKPTVFAASVFFQLAQYIPVTLTGLALFLRSGVSMRQVETEAPSDSAMQAGTAAASS